MEERVCHCDWCKLSDRIKAAKASTDSEEAKDMIDYLANELIMTSEDNNYHDAIMDGSWPSAVEQLERALENAKNVRRKQDQEEARQEADLAHVNGDLADSRAE